MFSEVPSHCCVENKLWEEEEASTQGGLVSWGCWNKTTDGWLINNRNFSQFWRPKTDIRVSSRGGSLSRLQTAVFLLCHWWE